MSKPLPMDPCTLYVGSCLRRFDTVEYPFYVPRYEAIILQAFQFLSATGRTQVVRSLIHTPMDKIPNPSYGLLCFVVLKMKVSLITSLIECD